VSVVIPVKDRVELLEECLDSVFAQTVLPHEVIVVDDGSTPPIAQMLSVDGASRNRLKIIRIEQSAGANHARNVGVRAATGDYVAFQDSDDIWLPTKLEAQLEAAETCNDISRVLVYCPVERHLGDGRVVRFPPVGELPVGRDVWRQLRRGNFVSTQTVLARRELLLRFAFDERLPRLQDWEAWIRISEHADVVAVPDALAISRETAASITTNGALYEAALPLILRRHRHFFDTDPAALAHWARAATVFALRRRDLIDVFRWARIMLCADARGSRSLLRGKLPRLEREHGSIPDSEYRRIVRARSEEPL
jgi:glycosyltransferase involved in cell wall biosynthesis